MKNTLGVKLVVVMDSTKMMLYEAQGTKIINNTPQILDLTLAQHPHHILEKHESLYKKQSTPGSLFEPHTLPKELEHQEATKIAVQHLIKVTNNAHLYRELIIVAEPKMLGYFRNSLPHKLKKIVTKELAKDLIYQDKKTIEHLVFS